MHLPESNLDKLRYKYLAYSVIRDAIGFYFGIPKFLNGLDVDKIVEDKLQTKIAGREVSEKQVNKHRRLIAKAVTNRLKQLDEDYSYCQDVLFNDNIWLQHLDIDVNFFRGFLGKLAPSVIDELAIVPNWTTRDDSLKRPFLNVERDAHNIKF